MSLVVREDGGNRGIANSEFIRGATDRSASGAVVKLAAYQNDILHALVETGGLPGLTAKNRSQSVAS